MRALMAIAEREIKDRWLLLAGALFYGTVPWILSPLDPSRLGVATGGVFVAFVYTAIVALLTGWSVIGKDLSEGRLAFFFSRPAPWWAIWGGKWLAAVLLTLGTALVMWLMVIPLDPEARTHMLVWLVEGSVALAGSWCLLALAMSHAASVAYRSRSPLLALDLVLLIGSLLLGFNLAWPLMVQGSIDASGHVNWTLALGFLIVAAIPTAAGAVQVHAGRVDRRRGHRALSLTLWAGVAILLLGLGAWSHRVTHPTIADLESSWEFQAAPSGTWIDISGDSGGRNVLPTAFLVDSTSGRWIHRPFGSLSQVAFSADGRRAVWLGTTASGVFRGDMNRLFIARLDGPSPEIEGIALGVPQKQWVRDLALSPDASRLAVIGAEMLDVYELPSGQHIAAIPPAQGGWCPPLRFRDTKTLHAYRSGAGSTNIFTGSRELVDVDIESRRLTPLGRVAIEEGQQVAQVTDDDHVVTTPGSPGRQSTRRASGAVQVFEMPSGRELLSVAVSDQPIDVRLIEGDRLAILRRDGAHAPRLDLHGPDGALLWSTALPGVGAWGTIGAQPTPETLAVANGAFFMVPAATGVVELSTGKILESHKGVTPFGGWRWIRRSAQPGSLGTRVLTDGKRGLFVMEAGGLRTVIAPRPASL